MVPMPEHMMATFGSRPVRTGTRTVEPNMLIMCWMPSGMARETETLSSTPIISRSCRCMR